MDILYEYVEINGKRYKLQHPGNREVLKLRARCINPGKGTTDLEQLMDYCFEHVVVPEGHGFKPTVDNLHPKEFEEWVDLLPAFLRLGNVGRFKASKGGAEEGRAESTA